MKRTFILSHVEARKRAVACVAEAPEGYSVTVAEPTRNLQQNALLHALLTEVSERMEWAGKKWSVEEWKRLLTSAWCRTRNEQALMVPAIDGHGFEVLYRRTSQLSKSECADLIDYITAWSAEHAEA